MNNNKWYPQENSRVVRQAACQLEPGAPLEKAKGWTEGMLKAFGFGDQGPEEGTPVYVPKTNAHLEALDSIMKSRKGKKVPLDQFGIAKVACWCRVGEDFCQICDDRQGDWAQEQTRQDPTFKRYQAKILGQHYQSPRVWYSKRPGAIDKEVPLASASSVQDQQTEGTRERKFYNRRTEQRRFLAHDYMTNTKKNKNRVQSNHGNQDQEREGQYKFKSTF